MPLSLIKLSNFFKLRAKINLLNVSFFSIVLSTLEIFVGHFFLSKNSGQTVPDENSFMNAIQICVVKIVVFPDIILLSGVQMPYYLKPCLNVY